MNIDEWTKLLREVTTTAGAETFTGTSGDFIDQKFAGPYHPEYNDLKKSLEHQIENDIIKRMYTDDVTPIADQDYVDLEWLHEYDEDIDDDKSKFKNKDDQKWQFVDMEIPYDEIIDKTEENKKFINPTNDWLYIANADIRR